jgi:lysyl-tRNA synthetase class 2
VSDDTEALRKLINDREEKLAELATTGDPYPRRFDRTHTSEQIRTAQDALLASGEIVRYAGRLMAKRGMGKTMFAPVDDEWGRLQIYVKKDDLGEDIFHRVQKLIDIGDFVGVAGYLFLTKTGELTIHVTEFTLLAKSLRPLPEKYHEMNLELRSRRRYLDLAMNEETRARFRTRSAIISAVRAFLGAEAYLEVETPALQPLYGGATARPFVTHHNALDMTLYLRIADELYLKRCIVGGFDRVYEIAKDFRNEGMDRTHSPEFTMLECYAAYQDYHDMMDLTERLLRALAERFGDGGKVPYGEVVLDFTAAFARVRFLDALDEKLGLATRELDDPRWRISHAKKASRSSRAWGATGSSTNSSASSWNPRWCSPRSSWTTRRNSRRSPRPTAARPVLSSASSSSPAASSWPTASAN